MPLTLEQLQAAARDRHKVKRRRKHKPKKARKPYVRKRRIPKVIDCGKVKAAARVG